MLRATVHNWWSEISSLGCMASEALFPTPVTVNGSCSNVFFTVSLVSKASGWQVVGTQGRVVE